MGNPFRSRRRASKLTQGDREVLARIYNKIQVRLLASIEIAHWHTTNQRN